MFREKNRKQEMLDLMSKGIVPRNDDLQKHPEKMAESQSYPMGYVAALINDVLPAKTIVDNMVNDAATILQERAGSVRITAKL